MGVDGSSRDSLSSLLLHPVYLGSNHSPGSKAVVVVVVVVVVAFPLTELLLYTTSALPSVAM